MNLVPPCVLLGTETMAKEAFDQMMAGDNRQPCFVCKKKVKAEYCFCHLCGLVFCDIHNEAHRPGGLT